MGIATSMLLIATIQASPAPDRVVLEPAELSLPVDASAQVEATAYDADGAVVSATRVRWFSTDPEIATVSPDGLVTAVRPGTAQVAALIRGKAGRTDVTVPQLPPASLELVMEADEMRARTVALAHVSARTRLGDLVDAGGVRFESSDPSVVAVDPNGRLWAVEPGDAMIRASIGEVSTEASIRVTANPSVSYEISPDQIEAETGDVVRFRVIGRTRDGSEVTGFRPLWTVDGAGTEVRAEGEDGVFVAEQPGTYRVTALVGEGTATSAIVTVVQRTIPECSITHLYCDLVG